MEEDEKKVDGSWKDKVEQEKRDKEESPAEQPVEQTPDFAFFVTTLSLQASMALGLMPNPVTNKVEENLTQAKLIIDTLAMLKEKTQGNLSTEEDSLLDGILYELRMHYVRAAKEKT